MTVWQYYRTYSITVFTVWQYDSTYSIYSVAAFLIWHWLLSLAQCTVHREWQTICVSWQSILFVFLDAKASLAPTPVQITFSNCHITPLNRHITSLNCHITSQFLNFTFFEFCFDGAKLVIGGGWNQRLIIIRSLVKFTACWDLISAGNWLELMAAITWEYKTYDIIKAYQLTVVVLNEKCCFEYGLEDFCFHGFD